MDVIGSLAAACVLATFCMQSMIALRGFAIASNLLFIAYSLEAHLLPILFLHAILLPINCWSFARLLYGKSTAAAVSAISASIAAFIVNFYLG